MSLDGVVPEAGEGPPAVLAAVQRHSVWIPAKSAGKPSNTQIIRRTASSTRPNSARIDRLRRASRPWIA